MNQIFFVVLYSEPLVYRFFDVTLSVIAMFLCRPAILEYLAKRYTDYAGFGKTLQTRTKCASLLSWTNSELHR